MLLHRLTSSSQGRETIKRHVTTDHADTPFHEFRDRICPETWRASGSSNEYRLTISRHRRMPWAPFRASVKNPDAHPLPLPQLDGMGVILKGPSIEGHDIRAHGRHLFSIGAPPLDPGRFVRLTPLTAAPPDSINGSSALHGSTAAARDHLFRHCRVIPHEACIALHE